MSRFWIVFGVLCLAAAFAAVMAVVRVIDVRDEGPRAGPVASIVNDSGVMGTLVHIGNGAALTAHHVTKDSGKSVTVRLDDDTLTTASILWSSEDHDIAFLRLESHDGMGAANLSCDDPGVGDPITTYGNLMQLGIVAKRGFIAAPPRDVKNFEVIKPIFLDVAIIPGMSGGAVFNRRGDLIGIILAYETMAFPLQTPFGTLPDRIHTGISYATTGAVICGLLARV